MLVREHTAVLATYMFNAQMELTVTSIPWMCPITKLYCLVTGVHELVRELLMSDWNGWELSL